MPKVRGWKAPLTEEQRLAARKAATERILRQGMLNCGVRSIRDLADLAGFPEKSFYKKFQAQSWTQDDLCRLVSVLQIPAEAAARLVGAA